MPVLCISQTDDVEERILPTRAQYLRVSARFSVRCETIERKRERMGCASQRSAYTDDCAGEFLPALQFLRCDCRKRR